MRRMLGLAVLLLAFCPNARADWRINRAQAVARAVFPETPCEVVVSWGRVDDYFADHSPYMRPLSWAVGCRVVFDRDFEDRWQFPWDEFCTLMIHEYGHINGLQHSTNPRSVMRSVYDDGPPDRRCRKRGRPFLTRHGELATGTLAVHARARNTHEARGVLP